MDKICVLKPTKYNVYIGNNITYRMLERFTFDKVLVIADDNLEKNDIDNIVSAFPNSYLYLFKACEENKSMEEYNKIIDKLIDLDFGKCDYVLAFGGGVTLDLAGYVASTYKRGIKLIYVPTSMLAMVDASVGGKVAINYRGIKNAIGTFYAPELVIIDPYYLHSLDKRYLNCGLMEAYKMGLTLNKSIIDAINKGDLLEVIKLSISEKTKIVNVDPFDKDLRHVLNFAHTLAHAIELACPNYLHGELVGYSLQFFILDQEIKQKVISDVAKYIDVKGIDKLFKENKELIINNIKNDKKVVNSQMFYINEVFLNKINDYVFKDIKISDYEVMINE